MRLAVALLLWVTPWVGGQSSGADLHARIPALFEAARQAAQRGRTAEAVEDYDRILAIDPSIAEVWTNRGLALVELKRHREAIDSFAKATALKPSLAVPHAFLGFELIKTGKPERAIAALRRALELEPNNSPAALGLSRAYMETAQFKPAVGVLRGLLRGKPNNAEALYLLGNAYLQWSGATVQQLLELPGQTAYGEVLLGDAQSASGAVEEAGHSYHAAVAFQPSALEARLALSRYALRSTASLEHLKEAEQQLEAAESIAPRDPGVEMGRVRLALLRADFENAGQRLAALVVADRRFVERHLSELVSGAGAEIQPMRQWAESHVNDAGLAGAAAHALIFAADSASQVRSEANREVDELARRGSGFPPEMQLRSYSQQLRDLEQKDQPLTAAEHIGAARLAWNLGEYETALDAVLELAPEEKLRGARLYWLSRSCRELARETLESVITQNPDFYGTHLLLAELAADSGDATGARREYEKAIEHGGANPQVYLFYVRFLASIGDAVGALEKATSAAEQFPDAAALQVEKGQLLLKSGNTSAAEQAFRAALKAEPMLAAARAGVAECYAGVRDYSRAIAEIKLAVAEDTDGTYNYRLGTWYKRTGQNEAAQRAFARATRIKDANRARERVKFVTTMRNLCGAESTPCAPAVQP